MKIDGREIAEDLLDTLYPKVNELKKNGLTPTLAVILVGDDPGSLSYIKQKKNTAEKIGAKLLVEQLPATTSTDTLLSAISHFNKNSSIHGIIIQRPVPILHAQDVLRKVTITKDIDGFLPRSPFAAPVARAITTILGYIHRQLQNQNLIQNDFLPWIQNQNIAIVGRGETAGVPISIMLEKYACIPTIIHSQTQDPQKILKNATIIISCAGKPKIITKSNITAGVILIGVGLFRMEDGKLHGDYDEEEIKDIASFYTPTPGGVGPVNVASLMQNLVEACTR